MVTNVTNTILKSVDDAVTNSKGQEVNQPLSKEVIDAYMEESDKKIEALENEVYE